MAKNEVADPNIAQTMNKTNTTTEPKTKTPRVLSPAVAAIRAEAKTKVEAYRKEKASAGVLQKHHRQIIAETHVERPRNSANAHEPAAAAPATT